MKVCSVCGNLFPAEHSTICLIGDTLCPPCEVKQRRYPHEQIMKLGEIEISLSKAFESFPEQLCYQSPDCKCKDCSYDRAHERAMQKLEDEETARLEKIRELAQLPIYQGRN